VDANWTMLRFGQDGLALLSYDNIGISPAVSELILLRGPFIAPLELGTNTAASLSSSSATTVAHGSGNTMLTLTGSNFLPGVAVTWNGAYRTTTIVDATHVTVAIPASDLASAGTATLVATNPGAAASSALHVTIN
jgi:trimeric autotransporter adhesin